MLTGTIQLTNRSGLRREETCGIGLEGEGLSEGGSSAGGGVRNDSRVGLVIVREVREVREDLLERF